MPARIKPHDWDRLFRPSTPQRGGPLNALVNILIICVVLGIFTGGTVFAVQYNAERQSILQATQAVQSTEQAVSAIETEATQAAESMLQQTAAAVTDAMFAEAIGAGQVIAAGNLRTEPVIAPETVAGQICIGDTIAFLEQRVTGGTTWYRIRIINTTEECTPQRVPIGTVGWASNTLLSAPGPVPTPGS